MADSKVKYPILRERLRKICIALHGKEHGIATFLSKTVGVSNSTASKYLNGHVHPEPDRMPQIAEILGVSVDWLEGRDHQPPKALADLGPSPDDHLVGKAGGIVLYYAIRLKPEISQDELSKVMDIAYQKLKAGEPKNAVTGDIVAILSH